ncbi:GNAT family N-acetyltransferase [Rossellomorea sp. GAMAL-10_SWC]
MPVTDKETGELFGAISLSNNQKFNYGEIAYWIDEEFWGCGYATEAAQAILRFAFVEKQYHKVFARYFNTNPVSGRGIQKIGMKKEGKLIDHVKKENQLIISRLHFLNESQFSKDKYKYKTSCYYEIRNIWKLF